MFGGGGIKPVPTRLCHVIYYHGDKKYPYSVVIRLIAIEKLPPSKFMHVKTQFCRRFAQQNRRKVRKSRVASSSVVDIICHLG